MWLEIYNHVTTKRKFIIKIQNRFFIRQPMAISQFIEFLQTYLKYHISNNENINFLLISKFPYIAIKI